MTNRNPLELLKNHRDSSQISNLSQKLYTSIFVRQLSLYMHFVYFIKQHKTEEEERKLTRPLRKYYDKTKVTKQQTLFSTTKN